LPSISEPIPFWEGTGKRKEKEEKEEKEERILENHVALWNPPLDNITIIG